MNTMKMIMNSIPCQFQNHQNHKIITVCLYKNCPQKRLCCLQCLVDFHSDHLNHLAEIDSLNTFIQEQSNKQVEYPQSYTYGQCQLIQGLEGLLQIVDSFQKSIKKEIQKLREQNLQEYIKQQSNIQDEFKKWNTLIQGILKFIDNENGHLKSNNSKQVPLNLKEQQQIQIINKAKETLSSIEKSIIKSYQEKQYKNDHIKLDVNQGSVKGVAISYDGDIIATGSDNKTVKLWNTNTKQLLQTLQYTGAVYEVVISSNNQYLAFGGGGDYSIQVYDLKQKCNYATLIGHQQYVQTIVFSQDQQNLYSGGSDNKVTIWDLKEKKQIQSFETDSLISTIVSSLDNKLISCICMDSINIWNLSTNTKQIHKQNPHDKYGYGLCSTYDSSIFISSGSDGLIKFWSLNKVDNNLYSLTTIRLIKAASKVIFGVILTPDEQNIISICNQEAKICIYQIESEKLIQELKYRNKNGDFPNVCISLSHHTDVLVSCGEDENIEIWSKE